MVTYCESCGKVIKGQVHFTTDDVALCGKCYEALVKEMADLVGDDDYFRYLGVT